MLLCGESSDLSWDPFSPPPSDQHIKGSLMCKKCECVLIVIRVAPISVTQPRLSRETTSCPLRGRERKVDKETGQKVSGESSEREVRPGGREEGGGRTTENRQKVKEASEREKRTGGGGREDVTGRDQNPPHCYVWVLNCITQVCWAPNMEKKRWWPCFISKNVRASSATTRLPAAAVKGEAWWTLPQSLPSHFACNWGTDCRGDNLLPVNTCTQMPSVREWSCDMLVWTERTPIDLISEHCFETESY